MAEFKVNPDAPRVNLPSSPLVNHQQGGGGGQTNIIGEQVSLSQNPVPIQNGVGVKSGQFGVLGDQLPGTLNRTPVKGWQSYQTPTSKRAVDASKVG